MRVYILIDPPQDYDESGMIMGVYGTHADAVKAEAKNRVVPNPGEEDYEYRLEDALRYSHIELWDGAQNIKMWGTTPAFVSDGKIEYEWKVMS